MENFLTNKLMKDFWKSVHIWQSYQQTSSGIPFLRYIHYVIASFIVTQCRRCQWTACMVKSYFNRAVEISIQIDEHCYDLALCIAYLSMTGKSWKWKSLLWFIPHFKVQTVSMPKVWLHVSPFWTAYFFVWTAHFGWRARLTYTMIS